MAGAAGTAQPQPQAWQFGDCGIPIAWNADGILARSPSDSGPHIVKLVVVKAGVMEGEHSHDRDHFIVLLTGRARMTCGGRAFDLTPGCIMLTPAGLPHAIEYVEATSFVLIGPGATA